MSLQTRIESAISALSGETVKIREVKNAAGGSINQSQIISLSNGTQFFLKTNNSVSHSPDIFEQEFLALEKLRETKAIRVPEPLVFGTDFIVMEVIRFGNRNSTWPARIGEQLAQMHLKSRGERYGFYADNYLGTTKQNNSWTDSWLEFWRNQRLAYQLGLYAAIAPADDELLILGDKLLNRLEKLIGNIDEQAVLLHGDLWSGNAAADENGDPVIYDPASYYGHRETEIGMMRMFGGFGPECEAAYADVWPFEEGMEERLILYQLYHELNHLNLFGSSYYGACLSAIRKLLAVL